MHFQIMIKKTHEMYFQKTYRISTFLLHFPAMQERHLQGTQRNLIKFCKCYVISAKIEIIYTSREYIKITNMCGSNIDKTSDKITAIM
jgi:hypothetical protein